MYFCSQRQRVKNFISNLYVLSKSYRFGMARIHSHRRGKSHSSKPTSRQALGWVTYSPDEITTLIVNLAKEGNTPSAIGIKLRDQYNIPLVKQITGKDILEVLRDNNLEPELPEELGRLLSRAKRLQTHLKIHKGDRKNVRSLELLEAKIHRLSKYYKKKKVLPLNWKYKAIIAQLT